MLSGAEIRDFREARSLSLREVAKFCDVSPQLIGDVERGDKSVTEHNFKQIIDGINKATYDRYNAEHNVKDNATTKVE